MNFSQGIPEQKFNVNRACFPEEKHQNSQKWAKFMNFSFWPFLWFGSAVLKILRVVNLVCVVNLLSHCDLSPRRTLCGHHFPGNYRNFSSQRSVRGVVNMGGVVKTLRRSNSLFLLSS